MPVGLLKSQPLSGGAELLHHLTDVAEPEDLFIHQSNLELYLA